MRISRHDGGTTVYLSARDTYDWAHRPGAWWPCSFLSGRRVVAQFDAGGDLIDVAIDGGRGDQDCPSHEFDAIISDLAGLKCPELAA